MNAIDQITAAARKLTPDQIRQRLDEIDQEAKVLRSLLRAAIRRERSGSARHFGSITQAAECLGVDVAYLARYCETHEVPGAVKVPFGPELGYVFDMDTFAAWVRSLDGGDHAS